MHNTKVQEYFNMYMDHFHLKKYIRFNTEILNVKQAHDFSVSGAWDVDVLDKITGSKTTETYDGIMVCTGHHAEIHWPKFPGQDEFQGQMVHTHDYKSHKGYENKKVVVIGIGNSGGDVAVELARISEQVGYYTIGQMYNKTVKKEKKTRFPGLFVKKVETMVFDIFIIAQIIYVTDTFK